MNRNGIVSALNVVTVGCVVVTRTRYSELKKYSSPMSLLIGPGAKGDWLVFEEISESQP